MADTLSGSTTVSACRTQWLMKTRFAEDGTSSRSKQSRSEKKSRKAMQKLGMKPVPNISRVTIKKSKNVSLTAILPVFACAVCRHPQSCMLWCAQWRSAFEASE